MLCLIKNEAKNNKREFPKMDSFQIITPEEPSHTVLAYFFVFWKGLRSQFTNMDKTKFLNFCGI